MNTYAIKQMKEDGSVDRVLWYVLRGEDAAVAKTHELEAGQPGVCFVAFPIIAPETATEIWGNYLIERRVEFGVAARRNRSSYSGTKIHRLSSEYVVGFVDVEKGNAERGTIGARFARSGKPTLFSCRPSCGCTQGQHAGSPIESATEESVNCTKCLK